MAITFHEQSREFHLTNGKISYIMEIMANGQMDGPGIFPSSA